MQLMGILNATPDSFFDRGNHFAFEKGIERGLQIAKEGAHILDIGGVSTRPGASPIDVQEELRRVIPLIDVLSQELHIPISIDTYRVQVAAKALEKGACMINDVMGFRDPAMQDLAASCTADLCVMHMQGTPETMQLQPHYPEGVVEHILHFFEERIETLMQKGVDRSRIILDPGIGFGKTVEHNFALLMAIDRFKSFGLRVLIGASRKSFIQQTLSGTLAVHALCFSLGADMIRVHDVEAHRKMLSQLPN